MRVPSLNTEAEAISYHVNLYYAEITEKPEIRADEQKNIALINHFNERYLKALSVNKLDVDEHKDKFLENIDYLTGVFTKKRQAEELSAARKAFRERNAKKPKII